MKKQALATLAILGATMGMGATPNTLPSNTQQQQQQKHNDAVEQTPTIVRQGRPTALNPTGGYVKYFKSGMSPKEYGQSLQATRRQKWVKSKK